VSIPDGMAEIAPRRPTPRGGASTPRRRTDATSRGSTRARRRAGVGVRSALSGGTGTEASDRAWSGRRAATCPARPQRAPGDLAAHGPVTAVSPEPGHDRNVAPAQSSPATGLLDYGRRGHLPTREHLAQLLGGRQRRGPRLHPVPTTAPATSQFIVARDQVCQFPGCNNPRHDRPRPPAGNSGGHLPRQPHPLCQRHHRANTDLDPPPQPGRLITWISPQQPITNLRPATTTSTRWAADLATVAGWAIAWTSRLTVKLAYQISGPPDAPPIVAAMRRRGAVRLGCRAGRGRSYFRP
jgi:hypothetical protein